MDELVHIGQIVVHSPDPERCGEAILKTLRQRKLTMAKFITRVDVPLNEYVVQLRMRRTWRLRMWLGTKLCRLGAGILGCEMDLIERH